MTADHPTREERYAAVLAEHRLTASGGCSCGWTIPRNVPFIATLEAHVAAALVAADPAPEAETLAAVRETLRRVRSGRRLSLRAVAVECGVSFNTLSRIERGTVDPSLSHVVAILHWAADPAPAQPDAALSDDERDRLAAIALRPWRCCPHCADDELHGPELVNNHDLPCDICLLDRLAARAAQPVCCGGTPQEVSSQQDRDESPAPEVSRGVAEAALFAPWGPFEMGGFDGCTDQDPERCACATDQQPTCEVCGQEIEPGELAWSRQWPCYNTLPLSDADQDWDVISWHDTCPPDRLVRDALGGERGEG